MSSTSEVGHKKNVANFGAAYAILNEMGATYNPTNTLIALAQLTPIQNTLVNDTTTLNTAMAIYRANVADKENAINTMGKKCTKIANYFKSLDVPQNVVDNIMAQVRNIRGDKRTKSTNPEQEDGNTISISQLSFDSRVANFNILIAQLEAFPEYAPNENEIKIENLKIYASSLDSIRNSARISGDSLITARNNRNQTLYDADPNVLELIKFIKAYVKSLGEQANAYYKALTRLKFISYKA